MDIYNKVETNFSNANQYTQKSSIQNKVRQLLLAETLKYSKLPNYNHIHKILNLGVRDLSEPFELNRAFNPNKIDIGDIAPPQNSNSIKNLNTYKLNFDKDLDIVANDYDLIFSNMSFQWSQDFKNLIENIASKLNNRSILAFSTILDDNFYELKDILRINSMYNKSSILEFIKKANLNCLYDNSFYINQNFNSFKEVINHLKSTGVNTYTGNKANHNYKKIKQLYSDKNQFNLSYHIGLFICFKE
ncbi:MULTISPECIES: biotin synthase [unclassified Francisella]|uniref:biotin synthase n=1 Tax=unclassified Francisella TaxID=2610885 RepID=UPI002E33D17A|nr:MULTISPECIES: biotin synthase [unclassified Francisella]MED7818859.1 biotin synthase [Francisella sp. 19S2-4]MED7829686.1 biotin synthase [Francisella sp. 19S2-10]